MFLNKETSKAEKIEIEPNWLKFPYLHSLLLNLHPNLPELFTNFPTVAFSTDFHSFAVGLLNQPLMVIKSGVRRDDRNTLM